MEIRINSQPCKGINLTTRDMQARRTPRVAAIHDVVKESGQILPVTPQFREMKPKPHASLRLCSMSSLPKGQRMCTKLVELFANRMVEGRNMINSIYRGEYALRVLGGVLTLSFSLLFPLFAIFCAIYWFCGFSFF
jgi:hypothetical protein